MTVQVALLCCGFVFAVAGCIPQQQSIRETPPVIVQKEAVVVESFTPDLKPGGYSKEIARLKTVIKSHPERSERVKAHLHLASLYASYKNPNKNYNKALEELNRYISLNPKAAKEYAVQNRLHLLKEIEQLSEKNVKLEQAIEELKLLDQQIEQKRERYR
jgi:outer membrane protein assembly factor BamD (BamD/ComL family)